MNLLRALALALALQAPSARPADDQPRPPNQIPDLLSRARAITFSRRWVRDVPYLWLDDHTLLLFKRVAVDAQHKDPDFGPIAYRYDTRTRHSVKLTAFSKRWATWSGFIRWARLLPRRRMLVWRVASITGPAWGYSLAPLDGSAAKPGEWFLRNNPPRGGMDDYYALRPSSAALWTRSGDGDDDFYAISDEDIWSRDTPQSHVRLQRPSGYRTTASGGWRDGPHQCIMLEVMQNEAAPWDVRPLKYVLPLPLPKELSLTGTPVKFPPGLYGLTPYDPVSEVPNSPDVLLQFWAGRYGGSSWSEIWLARRDLTDFRLVGRIVEPYGHVGFAWDPLFLAVRPDGRAFSFLLQGVLYECPLRPATHR